MRKRYLFTVAFLVFFILLYLFIYLPMTGVSHERKLASDMMMCSAPTRARIEAQLLYGSELLSTYDNPCPQQLDQLAVNAAGEITLVNLQYGIKLVLIPTMTDNRVSWRCVGSPQETVPMRCR